MPIPSTPTQDVAGSALAAATTMVFTVSAASSGNSFFVIYEAAAGSSTVSSISCTNCTFTKRQQASGVAHIIELWQGDVSGGASGTSVTCNLSGALASAAQGNITEWPGAFTLDVHNTIGSTNTNNPLTGTITPTASQNQVLFGAARRGGTFSSGPTNGWTALTTGSSTRLAAYLVVASTSGTYSTDWTFTAALAWESLYATFSQAGGTTSWGPLLGLQNNRLVA